MQRLPFRRILIALLAASPAAHAAAASTPADSLRAQIASEVATSTMSAANPSRDHGASQALREVYGRSAAPLWSRDGHPTRQAQALLRELQNAAGYGLQPQDYAGAALAQQAQAAGTAAPTTAISAWARFDVQLSERALRFMADLHYGRVDPQTAGFKLLSAHHDLNLADSLERLAQASEVPQALSSTEPPFYHYHLLKAVLPHYLELAKRPELTRLPAPAATLKPGAAYAGAAALRTLLTALGDMPPGSQAPISDVTFDADLSAGIRNFQQRHGLAADGSLGKSTFAALSTPIAKRVRQIDLTLERWRWLSPFKTPPIIVNIPQFRLFAFSTTEDRAADILQMDVIVGRTFPKMQTPVFESAMRYVVLRPYWDVPTSITRAEMLPKIRANPGFLAAQHLEIVNGQSDSSPTVPAGPEAIAKLAAGQYRLRQQPGEDNALGLIKFMFPNSYNVYLHSTPAHQLFKEPVRAFSHGCIRVSDPAALADFVLKNASGDWTREKIVTAMNAGKSQRVNLKQPIDVLILYATALATEAGPILFFEDIYGYDRKLERELGLGAAR